MNLYPIAALITINKVVNPVVDMLQQSLTHASSDGPIFRKLLSTFSTHVLGTGDGTDGSPDILRQKLSRGL